MSRHLQYPLRHPCRLQARPSRPPRIPQIAAVAAVILGYDWNGCRTFAAANPSPPLVCHGGGLLPDPSSGEWSHLCPQPRRDPSNFPSPQGKRRQVVAWVRAAVQSGCHSLSWTPSLTLGGPTEAEQQTAGVRFRAHDGTPLWSDDTQRWRHWTFPR